MVVDESSLLMAMVEILLASDGPQPVVIYTDVEMEDTIRLLPDGWRVEAVGEDSFGSRVSEALLNGPVVAFPPWGRQEGSPIPRETAALEGVHGGATSHYLLLVVPAAVLVSHAGKSLRTEISTRWQLMAVVSCMGAIVNVHHAFTAAVIMLSPIRLDRPVIRMFEASNRHTARQAILDDFKNLLRREGGTTEFGYVLREPPEIGAPLNYRLYDPRIVSRRAQLSDYGRTAFLDNLFEIFTGDPATRLLRRPGLVDPDTPGAGRLVSGREILRANVIAPLDSDSRWVRASVGQLQSGDIVVRSMHGNNPRHPGLVWARVDESDLPLVASSTVVVLRPRLETSPRDIDFVLRYLSTRHALELSEDPKLWGATMHLTPHTMASLRVPLPDEHLAEALRSVETARLRAAEWAEEADRILASLFENDSANMSRQNVIERSRIVRLRIQSVDDVETLSGQVRTQFPLPIAYQWRTLEARRSSGPSREAYLAALDTAEQTLAFTANVGLALARAAGIDVTAVRAIAEKLARRQGPSLADWSNILNELAGRACASIDDLIATTEFRDFCGDSEVSNSRRELLARRNDEAHQRRVESAQLGEALDEVVVHLEVLLRALSLWLDNPLVIAKSLRWDSLENAGSLSYQRLAGDHAIVQTQEMTVDTPVIELDSLYLLDSNRKLHLLRPYLIGTNCSQCGTFSIFHIDRFLNSSLSMKSMEHGHTIDAPESLSRAVRATGLLGTEAD